MNTTTAEQIMQAIADCKDDDLRAILIIIHSGFSQLSTKVDSILGNEEALKRAVLNGHSESHDEDHVWIAAKRFAEIENAKSKRKIGEGIVEKIIIAMLSVLVTLILSDVLK